MFYSYNYYLKETVGNLTWIPQLAIENFKALVNSHCTHKIPIHRNAIKNKDIVLVVIIMHVPSRNIHNIPF